jgi:Rrf2 family cysteine metabolism transcriptional repressor
MRLTSRIDYGLRAMLDLALHHGGGPVQNQEISKRQRIPEQYLKQILPALRRRGLVVSARGPLGGHQLARRPDQVTVAEILRALEGGLQVLDIGPTGAAASVDTGPTLSDFWSGLRREMEKFLEATTLEELCRKKRRHDRSLIYHI